MASNAMSPRSTARGTNDNSTTNIEDIQIATPDERQSIITAYGLGNIAIVDDHADLAEFVQVVCAELLALRTDNEALRKSLAKEVRTERLAVVHPDDGRELVWTDVLPECVSLTVSWLPLDARNCASAAIVSARDGDADQSTETADIYVSGAGNISAKLSTIVRNDGGRVSAEGLAAVYGDDDYDERKRGSALEATKLVFE